MQWVVRVGKQTVQKFVVLNIIVEGDLSEEALEQDFSQVREQAMLPRGVFQSKSSQGLRLEPRGQRRWSRGVSELVPKK